MLNTITDSPVTGADDIQHDILSVAHEILLQSYKADDRPWVIAYSGGKDSTAVLQLVITMLETLTTYHKPIYVISSDTRVEAPNIVNYVERVLSALQTYGDSRGLPLHTQIVRPSVDQTFWAKLIGRGYPPPTRWFRWCTNNMKIKPARAAIDMIVREFGSVVLLLGSRTSESSTRSRAIASRVSNARGLNPHHEIPNAFVMTPIVNWSNDDVWEFLFENNPPPWQHPHDEMLTLYRQANGGECPVVMDLNTPSCGGSRFGCWTCTVVRLDRSMEGFIQSGGNEWMVPLNEFRNWLKHIREDPDWRQPRRRDGRTGIGPFTPNARQIILQRLLETEHECKQTLIRDEEIQYIQAEWSNEFDFQNSAINLARRFGRHIGESPDMKLSPNEVELISKISADHEVNDDVIIRLLQLEDEFPDVHAWGARTNLKRRIALTLEKAAKQAELADPDQ